MVGTTIDLESPVHKIISDLKSLQDEMKLNDSHGFKLSSIISALSKLDANLFTPDINAQMGSSNGVDVDTKNWAISVLGKKEYNPLGRKQPLGPDGRSKSSGHVLTSEHGAVFLSHMPQIETMSLQKIQARIAKDGWNLDVLGLDCHGHPVLYVGLAVFELHHLYDQVKVDPVALQNFLLSIDEGYLRNPYVRFAFFAFLFEDDTDTTCRIAQCLSCRGRGQFGQLPHFVAQRRVHSQLAHGARIFRRARGRGDP